MLLTGPRRAAAACVAAVLVLGGCVADTNDRSTDDAGPGSAAGDPSPESVGNDTTAHDPPPPVGTVEAALVEPADVSARAAVEVSFAPIEAADAYLLELDGRDEPIRLEADACDTDRCALALDRLTVGTSTEATVVSTAGDARAEPSPPTSLPPLDVDEPSDALDPDEPMTLVVVRHDGTEPTVDTEEVDDLSAAESRADELTTDPDVIAVEIDTRGFADQDGDDDPALPPDGLTTWQRGAMDFPLLPDGPRGEGVVIAVIDHGIQLEHEAFAGAQLSTTNVLSPGEDLPAEHGTSVVSMILGQEQSRVPGIAAAATVRVYDVFDGSESFAKSDVVRAIIQAVDDGADIINLSLSSTCLDLGVVSLGCPDTAMQAALDHAEQRGVVVVAAAGNDGDGSDACDRRLGMANSERWPANAANVVSVGGLARDGSVWACSPDKPYVDVLAPADSLLVANASGGYDVASGTSFAAPLVSGLLATVLAEHPDLSPAQLRDLLANAVDEHGRLQITMLLGPLDMVELPFVDTTTAELITPFQLDVRFPDEGRISELTDYSEEQPTIRIAPSTPDTGVGIIAIRINGLLFVDPDGEVTGFGTLKPFHANTSSWGPDGLRWAAQGFHVLCPRAPMNSAQVTPMFEFVWNVSAAVGGTYRDGEIDLTISLGDGATPDTPGELPPVEILRDDLAACQQLIEWPNTIASGFVYSRPSPFTYDEMLAQRDYTFETAEALHREFIDAGPFTVTAPFGPDEEIMRIQVSDGRYNYMIQFGEPPELQDPGDGEQRDDVDQPEDVESPGDQ